MKSRHSSAEINSPVRVLLNGCIGTGVSARAFTTNPHHTMPVSRDYTKEVGIPNHKKRLSRPVAFAVLALVGVGISFGVAGVISETKEHNAAEKAAKAASEPSKPVEPVPAPADKPAEPAK